MRAAQPTHVGQGESQANPARAAPLQDGRQTAAARRKRFIRFAPSRFQLGARPTCAPPHQRPTVPGRKSSESCNEGPLPEPTPPAADRSLVGGQDGATGDEMRRRGAGGGGFLHQGGEERRRNILDSLAIHSERSTKRQVP